MGFFIASFDTIFCSGGLIDSLEGLLDFGSISGFIRECDEEEKD